MTRSQELALDHIREAEIEHEAELDRLRDTVAEKEQEIAELRAELAERDADLTDVQNRIAYLAPVEPLMHALHALILRSDVVQYHAPSNTLSLGPATFAALGDQTILRELATAAKAFTEDK